MTLLLEGIIGSGRAFEIYFCSVNFKRLLCFGCFDNLTLDNKRGANVIFGNFSEIRKLIVINDLNRFKECTVGKHDESERFRAADTSDPAAYGNAVVVYLIALTVKLTK